MKWKGMWLSALLAALASALLDGCGSEKHRGERELEEERRFDEQMSLTTLLPRGFHDYVTASFGEIEVEAWLEQSAFGSPVSINLSLRLTCPKNPELLRNPVKAIRLDLETLRGNLICSVDPPETFTVVRRGSLAGWFFDHAGHILERTALKAPEVGWEMVTGDPFEISRQGIASSIPEGKYQIQVSLTFESGKRLQLDPMKISIIGHHRR